MTSAGFDSFSESVQSMKSQPKQVRVTRTLDKTAPDEVPLSQEAPYEAQDMWPIMVFISGLAVLVCCGDARSLRFL